jgi:hypothetical protein
MLLAQTSVQRLFRATALGLV